MSNDKTHAPDVADLAADAGGWNMDVLDLPGDPIEAPPADVWATLDDDVPAEWFDERPPRLEALLYRPTPNLDGTKHPLALPPDSDGYPAVFLPRTRVAMLVAPGGTGKTAAALQLACAVAGGGTWLDTFPVNPNAIGPVAVLLGEEDRDSMRRRLWRIANETGNAGEWDRDAARRHLRLVSTHGKAASLLDPEGKPTGEADALQATLRTVGEAVGGWSLIVLDPAARFLGPEAEKDNAAATRFIELLERMEQLPGRPTVLFCHHTNKGALSGKTDQGAARGSSALTDGCRWQANLERVSRTQDDTGGANKMDYYPDRARLRLVKANDVAGMGEALRLDRCNGGFLRGNPNLWPDEQEAADAKATKKAANAAEAAKKKAEAKKKATPAADDGQGGLI